MRLAPVAACVAALALFTVGPLRGQPRPASARRSLSPPGRDSATPAPAPRRQSEVFGEAVRAARAAIAALDGSWPWRSPAPVRWLGAHADYLLTTENPRDSVFREAGNGLWRGPADGSLPRANTAAEWRGARWALVRLPAGDDVAALTRLLVHEAMHVRQPTDLPFPPYNEHAAGAELLDEAEGRSWLALELRALAKALRARDDSLFRIAVLDAHAARGARRRLSAPAELARTSGLEFTEGLPEYLAFRGTKGSTEEVARAVEFWLASRDSWVRGFPYATGPAWGYVLDRLDPARHWVREAHAEHTGLGAIAGRSLRADPLGEADLIDLRWATYARDSIVAAERARSEARSVERERLTQEFVRGPVIRVEPPAMQITFDPRNVTPLGSAGTVYRQFRWSGPDGALLDAPAGALVSPDWRRIQLPLGSTEPSVGGSGEPLKLSGKGWTLQLPPGWRVRRDSTSWTIVPN